MGLSVTLVQHSYSPSCQSASKRRAPSPVLRHGGSLRHNPLIGTAPAAPLALPRRATLAADAGKGSIGPTWNQSLSERAHDKGVLSLTAGEVQERLESGEWLVVDVRPSDAFELSHIAGAVSVPLFDSKPTGSGNKLLDMLQFGLKAAAGVRHFSVNEHFAAQLKEAAGGKGVVLVCDGGGMLESSINFVHGKPSRSLMALSKALDDGGVERLAHLKRGLAGWHRAGLPFEGTYDSRLASGSAAASEPPRGKFENGRWVDDK